MAFFEWAPDLSVGHPIMDSQHETLISYINEFYELVESNATSATLVACMDKILDFTSVHFRDEEELMANANYPGIKHHQGIHKQLVLKVHSLRESIKRGDPSATNDTVYFLKLWLTSHIKGIDSDYRKYVNSPK